MSYIKSTVIKHSYNNSKNNIKKRRRSIDLLKFQGESSYEIINDNKISLKRTEN